MKSLDQIVRYATHCEFSDEDWQKVLEYCKGNYKGGKLHRNKSHISKSSFAQFLDWIDNGFGSGDFVKYGNMPAVIGTSTPDVTKLAAYCDYNGKLIVKDWNIMSPQRLIPLDYTEKKDMQAKIFNAGYMFSARAGMFSKMYTPKQNFCYTIDDKERELNGIGKYLKSDDKFYYFSIFLQDNELKLNHKIEINCTPLKTATVKEEAKLNAAITKKNLVYDQQLKGFIPGPARGKDNVYYYMNDRFEIAKDKDNGGVVHRERRIAGNYFLYPQIALSFMKEVVKIREAKF